MFRTTRHHNLRIPHGVALAAGLLALASWSWTAQSIERDNESLTAQQQQEEEVTQATVKEGGRALLDISILLLRRGSR